MTIQEKIQIVFILGVCVLPLFKGCNPGVPGYGNPTQMQMIPAGSSFLVGDPYLKKLGLDEKFIDEEWLNHSRLWMWDDSHTNLYRYENGRPVEVVFDPEFCNCSVKENRVSLKKTSTPPVEPLLSSPSPKIPIREKMRKSQERIVAYVEKYKQYVPQDTKIPPIVTLAQGFLESGGGESYLAREANNHFGVKCQSRSCWKGHCINASDDHHKDFFVKYKSVKDSYLAHEKIFESKPERYGSVFLTPDLNKKYTLKFSVYASDYKKSWRKKTVEWEGKPLKDGEIYTFTGLEWICIHLSSSGYATSQNYADKIFGICQIIQENFHL